MMHRVLSLGRARHVGNYFKRAAPGLFLQELFSRPGAIGAVCPSSRFLARRMAREVPLDGDGLIVELGAGTGVITQALLDRGVPRERLMVIEFSVPFVERLRKRFPGVCIVHGNAADLCQLVPDGYRVSAIVSSLPLCSLPDPITRAILNAWQLLLDDNAVAVQFTYNLGRPKWRHYLRAHASRSQIVWANLPPANVTTFSFKTAKLPPPHEHESNQSNC